MKGDILFYDLVSPDYLPLIQAVAERGFTPIMNATPLAQRAQATGVPFRAWEAFMPVDLQAHVQREIARIAGRLAKVLEVSAVRQAFSSPLGEFLPRTGEVFFHHLMGMLANEIATLETLETLTRQCVPGLIVLGCDNNHFQRALIAHAAHHGIPTLQLAHAIYGKLIHTRYAANMYTLYADYMAAFGQRARDDMVALGNSPDRIFLTGAPLWDRLYTPEARLDLKEGRRRLGLNPERSVVLLCLGYADGSSAFFPAVIKRLLAVHRAVTQAMRQLGEGVQLVVRPHPHELQRANLPPEEMAWLIQAYSNWLAEKGVHLAHFSREQKIETIRAADVVIAMGSSSVIPEVMILERPVVMLPWFEQDNHTFTERDGIVIVDDDTELPDVLATLLADPARRQAMVERQNTALPELNYGNDGRATERVAELIAELATTSKRNSVRTQPAPDTQKASVAPRGSVQEPQAEPIASREHRRTPHGSCSPRRVLFAYRSDVDAHGGAATVMHETCRALQELGVQVDVTYDVRPDVGTYDLVHVFNIWHPRTALEQLRHLRGTGVPIIWSPIYLHWCEYAWANLGVRAIYHPHRSPEERRRMLEAFTQGTLEINGLDRWRPNEVYPGFHRDLQAMLACVDHICVTSNREAQMLAQVTGWVTKSFTVTPHGVDAEFLQRASPAPFRTQFGVNDFVLCVGAVDGRKNQLLLVEALKGTDLQLVLVGPSYEPDYLEFCLREGGEQVLYTGRLPRELVASAYKAARVHALPSFAEGAALANLEAAAAGCALVVSNRSSEFEYFGAAPYYCDPTDPASIREAVWRAYQAYPTETAHWEALSCHVQEQFTWGRTAELTLQAYEQTLARKRSIRDKGTRGQGDRGTGRQRDKETRRRGAGEKSPCHSLSLSPALLWHAPLFDSSGYADEARQFVLGLDAEGVRVHAVPLNWSTEQAQLPPAEMDRLRSLTATPVTSSDDRLISVFHIFPPHFRRISGAAYHVGRTMFETDRIPEDWVAACNQMDEIWVPSDFNVETFARSGVPPEKLVKMPGGIDVERYRLDTRPVPIDGRRGFNFLSVFDWTWRKGWDVLLQAFIEEFRPEEDVALILKVWSSFGRTVEQLREEALSFSRLAGLADELPANVVFYQANLPTEQLPGLYRAADAFVLPTRGEGWGRPFMEAMLMGLPVIGTRWSGHLEFMNDDNAYLVDCQVVDVPEPAWREVPAFRGHRWAEPSVDHLRRLMRKVFEDRQDALRKGQAARQHIIANFSRKRVVQRVKDRLDVIALQRLEAVSRQRSAIRSPQYAVRWEGSQFVHHSLALVNREHCIRLARDSDVDLSIIPYEPHQFGPDADPRFEHIARHLNRPLSCPADVHVRHQWPPDFTPPPEGHWVIIQPWEFGSLPRQWVEVMSTQVDEIWVPSNYVRECYIRSGIPADRVHVVPNGVDTTRFRPDAPPLALKTQKRFKFLFVGGTIHRKGIDILLDAYMNTFTAGDDVCLVVKDMGGQSFYKGQTAQEIIAACQNTPDAPEIEYIVRTLDDEELAGLYTACDCLVHPYRGEGFGLPIAEAMASGRPVIVTGHGAALDFCTEENAYLIPAREVRLPEKCIGDLETVDYPWWAEPDREALQRLMQHVVDNPAEAKAKGQAARAYIQANFTWDHAAEAVRQRIRALRRQPVRRFALAGASDGHLAAAEEALRGMFEAGQAALERDDLETAAEVFTRVTEKFPELAAGHTALGSTLIALNQVEEAIPALRRAAELVPQEPALHNQLGVALYELGDFAAAEKAFQAALQGAPADIGALLNLVELYRAQDRYVEATECIKEALRVDPHNIEVLTALGTLSLDLGDSETARTALRHLQAIDPNQPAAQALKQILNSER